MSGLARRGLVGLATRLRCPLRAVLIVPFVVLATTAVGVTGYLALRNGQQAVAQLAAQLFRQIHRNVEHELDQFLAAPHQLNQLNADLLQREPGLSRDFAALRARYFGRLRRFESVMTCAVGFAAHGEFLGVGRRDDGTFDTAILQYATSPDYRHYLLDATGAPTTLLTVTPRYDARTRPWYVAGVQAGRATWSPIYVWAAGTTIGLTAVLPVYDAAGTLLGVQQAALSLGYISRFLAGLEVSRGGRIAVVERSGLLVAASTGESPIRRTPDGQPGRLPASDSADPAIRAAAVYLGERFGGLDRVPANHDGSFDLAGHRHVVQVAAFRKSGLDWLVVVAVPEAAVLGEIRANTRTTLFLCLATLLATIGVGVGTARWVTRPLLAVNAAAKALAEGAWDRRVPVDRRDEVGDLAAAFNRMAGQLQDLFLGLERRVAERTTAVAASNRELVSANAELQTEIDQRARIETALRASEEEFRAFFHTVAVGTAEFSLDGRFLRVNERLCEITGHSREEVLQMTIADLTHPDDRPQEDQQLVAYLLGQSPAYQVDKRYVRKDGQVIWMQITAAMVRDASGTALRSAGVIQDITGRKRAEEALRRAKDELERRVQERTAELAGAIETLTRQAQQLRALAAELTLAEQRERRRLAAVLHDGLQQLLVAARVRANMLGQSSDSGIRQGCEEIVALLQEALVEARTLTGELSPPTLRRGDVLAALKWLTDWMREKHRLNVRVHIPDSPLPVLAEDLGVLLYQSVRELLLNTVKYAQVPAADVTIVQQADALLLTVADAGVGFDPARLRVTGGGEGGFGLLSIHERLELLGGRLEILSAPGQGSQFTLWVPLQSTATAVPTTTPSPTALPPVTHPALRPTPETPQHFS
jgi:PAS domain S-box-containing protein